MYATTDHPDRNPNSNSNPAPTPNSAPNPDPNPVMQFIDLKFKN